VRLTIYSTIDNVDFVKFIANEQNPLGCSLGLAELMILRYLTDNRRIDVWD
jgi:ATP-dependent DNA helicase RecG